MRVSRIARSWIVPVAIAVVTMGVAFGWGLLLGAKWGNTSCFTTFDAVLAESER